MMKPTVSIIIPVYNAEKYLRRCVDSLINQTLPDIEIILVNDGSTDGSPDIIEEYASRDRRIRAIHQENKGGSSARNTGIECAKGEYLGFVDADDAISPDMYETMYNAAKQYDADIVTTGYKRYDETLNVILEHYPPIQFNKIYAGEEKIHLIEKSHKNKLLLYAVRNIFKRKMIMDNKILFNPETRVGNEILFNLYAFYASRRLVALKKAFYFYRDNPKSITQSRYKPHLEKSLQVQYEKTMEFYKQHGLWHRCSKGLYRKTAGHFLPMLLANLFALELPRQDSCGEIRRILKFPMIEESLKNTPLFNRSLQPGKQFIIMACKLRIYRLLWLFYTYKKRRSYT